MKMILTGMALCLFIHLQGKAQLTGENRQTFYPLNWHTLSFDKDSVYGLELDKAYEFLKGKTKKQKVIVAVIDGGFDEQHEDLKNVLWCNRREIPGNGIDDDKNGYTDDLHGWNFLVTKNGKPVTQTMQEGAVLFLRNRERYDVLSEKKRNDKEEKEYIELQTLFKKSELGTKYLSWELSKAFRRYIEEYDREMKARFPGETLGHKHFNAVLDAKNEKDTLKLATHMFYNIMWDMQPESDWEKMFAGRLASERVACEQYEEILAKQKDSRKQVGDDMENLKDRAYGSPVLLSETSEHGTHIAGIIGAQRDNGIGMDGIADNVELMLIGAIPNGDENDKDVALAIRYAVDNGAKIINMSFGKRVSIHPEWVVEAMRYAEKKGVLLVHAAGNSHQDIDGKLFYPTRHVSPKKSIGTFLRVGASDPQGNPAISSNYGKTEVDVFAPGVDIYSTVTGDNYRKMEGSSMACPMVSGVAALLMTYYPELSAAEIKDIIIRTAVTRKGSKIHLPQSPSMAVARKIADFADICVAGGIVNACEAVKLADRMANTKKK
ncbi:MAG: S8 family serine peptidase [Odoribacter sp.]|nr:S8 family serine peptidase [Odoribacter sp.]